MVKKIQNLQNQKCIYFRLNSNMTSGLLKSQQQLQQKPFQAKDNHSFLRADTQKYGFLHTQAQSDRQGSQYFRLACLYKEYNIIRIRGQYFHNIITMSRPQRSKTQPIQIIQKEGLPISWALVPRYSPEHQSRDASQPKLKLPKIKMDMNQVEKEIVNNRILRLKRLSYDPVGCSKSLRLEKVRLRKKLNQKSWLQKYEESQMKNSFLPQIGR